MSNHFTPDQSDKKPSLADASVEPKDQKPMSQEELDGEKDPKVETKVEPKKKIPIIFVVACCCLFLVIMLALFIFLNFDKSTPASTTSIESVGVSSNDIPVDGTGIPETNQLSQDSQQSEGLFFVKSTEEATSEPINDFIPEQAEKVTVEASAKLTGESNDLEANQIGSSSDIEPATRLLAIPDGGIPESVDLVASDDLSAPVTAETNEQRSAFKNDELNGIKTSLSALSLEVDLIKEATFNTNINIEKMSSELRNLESLQREMNELKRELLALSNELKKEQASMKKPAAKVKNKKTIPNTKKQTAVKKPAKELVWEMYFDDFGLAKPLNENQRITIKPGTKIRARGTVKSIDGKTGCIYFKDGSRYAPQTAVCD